MAAVYKMLVNTNTTAALAAASIESQITAIIALANVHPAQVTVLSAGCNATVNAASADSFTAFAMVQYNTD